MSTGECQGKVGRITSAGCHMHTILRPSWILSRITRVSWHQKGKTNLDLLEQEIVSGSGPYADLDLIQTDNHASIPPLSFFYMTDAFPAAQPTASKH